jgi:hypothetical protein
MLNTIRALTLATLALGTAVAAAPAMAQERLPWERDGSTATPADSPRPYRSANDAYRPSGTYRPNDAYRPSDPYRQAPSHPGYSNRLDDAYRPPAPAYGEPVRDPAYGYGEPRREPGGPYGQPYEPVPRASSYDPPPPLRERAYDEPRPGDGTYSRNEILDAGHRFFGRISAGLASVIEYAFQRSGRPNGYILGDDVGGAFVAGLRYGEGVLHTKDAGIHRVYWQGPSLGYDFGGEGSKTMVLVYNLRDPSEIYHRFGGIQGSAYLVGGVSIQFQKHDDVVLAPIRSGIGLRLGANIGYLKYTRTPTWNPF